MLSHLLLSFYSYAALPISAVRPLMVNGPKFEPQWMMMADEVEALTIGGELVLADPFPLWLGKSWRLSPFRPQHLIVRSPALRQNTVVGIYRSVVAPFLPCLVPDCGQSAPLCRALRAGYCG